jgi:hypothetical protein
MTTDAAKKNKRLLLIVIPAIALLAVAVRIPFMMGPTAYFGDVHYWRAWMEKIQLLGLRNFYATNTSEVIWGNSRLNDPRLWSLVDSKKRLKLKADEFTARVRALPEESRALLIAYMHARQDDQNGSLIECQEAIRKLKPEVARPLQEAIDVWEVLELRKNEILKEASALAHPEDLEKLTRTLGLERRSKLQDDFIQCDYPPGYAYVLVILPRLYTLLAGGDMVTGKTASELYRLSITAASQWLHFRSRGRPFPAPFPPKLRGRLAWFKAPAVLADLLTCILLVIIGWKLASTRRGILAGALYAVLPSVFYDSAVWGQVDAIHTLFMLLCLLAFMERRLFI